jgi:hypothetical protein
MLEMVTFGAAGCASGARHGSCLGRYELRTRLFWEPEVKNGGRVKTNLASARLLAKAGSKVDHSKALVVLRKGNAIDQAKVLEKHFTIETEELGDLNSLMLTCGHLCTIGARHLRTYHT